MVLKSKSNKFLSSDIAHKNLKSLNIYSEYIKNSKVGSIKDNISTTVNPYKEDILEHLRRGKHIAALCGGARDIFTGKPIKGEWLLLSDGEYKWTTDIIYYFEKYNLILLDEFVYYVYKIVSRSGKYICDDRPIPITPEFAKMSDEEIEEEFKRLFPNAKDKQ